MTHLDRLHNPWLSRQEAVLLLALAFVSYCGLTIVWSRGDQLYATIYLASLALAYIIGFNLRNPRPVWIAFALLAVAVLILGPTLGPNYIGAACAMLFAAGIAYYLWPLIVLGLVGVAYSQSRSAILATGVITLISVWRINRLIAIVLGLLSIIAIAIVKSDIDASFLSRLGIWQDTLNHMTLQGHGFGSFAAEYAKFPIRTNMTLVLAPHAYNDFIELIFELGLGAVAIGPLLVLSLAQAHPSERLIATAFGILSLTFFPLYVPLVGHMFLLTLGHAARGHYRKA